ncbi:MAG: LysM peptidoglycan-binding domain-containing protein [Jatrophihabitans sp.]
MSVATEYPPEVYIPERARRPRPSLPAEHIDPVDHRDPVDVVYVANYVDAVHQVDQHGRHLALVPARRWALVPGQVVPQDLREPQAPPRDVRQLSGPSELSGLRVIARDAAPGCAPRQFRESRLDWPLTVTPAAAPLRLTRRGIAVVVLATLVLGMVLLLIAHASAGGSAAATPALPPGTVVTVQPGDTLWSIAQRADPNRDPRRVVDQLRELNHLASPSLTAGQTLKVG